MSIGPVSAELPFFLDSLEPVKESSVGQFAEWLSNIEDRTTLSSIGEGWTDLTRTVFQDSEVKQSSFEEFEKRVFSAQVHKIQKYMDSMPKSGGVVDFSHMKPQSEKDRYLLMKHQLLDAYQNLDLSELKKREVSGLEEVHNWAILMLKH